METQVGKDTPKVRYYLLDELRGFAIILMILYHGFFLTGQVFGYSFGNFWLDVFMPVEPVFAGLFIIISGICCRFSHSNAKRGTMLLVVALALTGVTFEIQYLGIDEPILFGILHLLSISMLVFAALHYVLDRIPALLQIIVFAVVFVFTYQVPEGILGIGGWSMHLTEPTADQLYLFPFGFRTSDFYSSDYFPLLPWLFLFLLGSALGIYANRGKFPKFFSTSHIKPLQFVGRHSLIIYLAHVPVLYIVVSAVSWVISLF
jgi:uncharacterized membrane protein